MTLRGLAGVFKTTLRQWWDSRTFELGAALAYYSVFSLAPILVIALGIAGLVFGQQAAEGHLQARLEQVVGPSVAKSLVSTLSYAHTTGTGRVATIVGAVLLVFGAIGLFTELQSALNSIWNVVPKPGRGLWGVVKDRLLSFVLVLLIGVLLLASLVASTTISSIGSAVHVASVPGGMALWEALRWAVSLALLTLLFALIYKILPDVKMSWKDVWVGSAATALLFTVGSYLIGLYLGRGSTTSAYGAAGSLVVVLMWVYYSSQIVLFGAEFTQVYARKTGNRLEPADNAMRPAPDAAARHGLAAGPGQKTPS